VARRDSLIRRVLRERFIVTMLSGATFDGLLMDLDDSTLHLVDAYAIEGKDRIRADGSLYLPRTGVDYIQRPS